MAFKKTHSIEKRRKESSRIIEKYPERVPVIVEKSPTEKKIENIDRSKFLVPQSLTFGEFAVIVRKRLRSVQQSQGLYLFVGHEVLVTSSSMMGEVYEQHRDEDGFLYVVYAAENTFGHPHNA